ncbi:TetR/AcrR family transcriptional regulator [Cerasicoccus arenae]|uniref:HTH tetR-type domain-containing protein n=1 Tax=Cerasicoccus arenae TaxID=424488 RepID=A0A8J3DEZ5_9BACT|nr:helix-turn-helix domain-containing protein [Cerasicoccus arenae]MBK1859677.1 helix-turn-helix transcriptional regulator [Cerasicoccus arenae]GHB92986.1 hypothetical protein GCM10007047_05460 [Cerasicoccus arenae]
MKRNRQQTEKRIVEAAIRLLADEGFQSFGVNAVAAHASVDKVLIYRYFSGLDGLLDFIGNTEVLFPSAAAMLDTDLTGFYRNFCRALDENRLGACVQNWERVTDNPLTEAYRRQRSLFWDDASSLLRPQSEAAHSLLKLLAAAPLHSVTADALSPLLSVSEFSPVEAPIRKTDGEPAERLADNLL